MAKKNNPYFNDFGNMIELSCRAAEHLEDCLKDFKPETLYDQRKIMHDIEHSEDQIKHDMMRRLVKEFVPPIDREDIIMLANELDSITDKIEDILIRMFMYNIKKIRSEAEICAGIITRCCKALREAIIELPNFQKSTLLAQKIIDVNSMEEEGDKIYIKAVRRLHEESVDPLEISAWNTLFDLMEECCDACEHAANLIETVVMKNS